MSKLTFLFWNLGRKATPELVAEIAHSEAVDVLMLVEADFRPVEALSALNSGAPPHFHWSKGNCARIQIYCRFGPEFATSINESSRHTVRRLGLPGRLPLNLVVTHLPSKLRYSDEDQGQFLIDFARSIREAERQEGHTRTILVGDLNVDPFEKSVVALEGLHAVGSRAVATTKTRERP